MFDRIDQGFAASPVSSTTAADVSSQDVSIPRISISTLQEGGIAGLQEGKVEGLPPSLYPFCNSAILPFSKAFFRDSVYGALKMPFSVMMPAISRCGVTSNPGFQTLAPAGATCDEPTCV